MIQPIRRLVWVLGWPARAVLVGLIRVYRMTLGTMMASGCRFTPSCSRYAEEAILHVGAVRGSALALWRVARCSPLGAGGVDRPPAQLYDADIQPVDEGSPIGGHSRPRVVA